MSLVCVQVKEVNAQLREAQQGARNKTATFGGNAVIQLCNMIEAQAQRFHRKPIGPIGDCLELNDERCARHRLPEMS